MEFAERRQTASAFETCAALMNARDADDCRLIVVGQLAEDALPEQCDWFESSLFREECGFMVAEQTADPDVCGAAGRFETQCRLHFYRDRLPAWVPSDSSVAGVDGLAVERMTEVGLGLDVEAAWYRTYALVAERRGLPLAAGECADLEPVRAAACLDAVTGRPDGRHRLSPRP
jgi:hypothetical protein